MTGMNPLHEQAEMFRDALALTRQRTGFAERLIEKDYFCTALLEYLASASEALVFKGGTCLAKVHTDFYRLSEDLDFVIPVAAGAPRSQRSKKALPLKEALAALPERRPFFRLVEPLAGANNSTTAAATPFTRTVAPTAKRSESSLGRSTKKAPFRPCGLPTRPIETN